jgi:TetR/AcrR family transcriptional regulator, fatty acid metabolism regulator protein
MTRMCSADRKHAITSATLVVVASDGLEGATTARIAEAAGLSPAALYKHFATRRELLIAALDSLYDHIYETLFGSTSDPDVLERLRKIGRLHSDLIASGKGSFIYPLFEFLAAPPESGLREAQGERQLQMINLLAAIVEEGREQGSIRPEVDSEQLAWALHAVWWAEDISHLMGLDQFVTAGRSTTILNDIFARIANRPDTPLDDPAMEKLQRLLASCPLVNAPAG